MRLILNVQFPQKPFKKSLISPVIALVVDLPMPLRKTSPVGGSDACYSCNVIMLIRLGMGHFQGGAGALS